MKRITEFYKTYKDELENISSLACSLRFAIDELKDLAHKEWEETQSHSMEENLSFVELLLEEYSVEVEHIEHWSADMANGGK